tara:strand:+ start:3042 stop:4499 length:1458 start_codon:yes stop_codon:yes gene_type:complete
MAKKAPSLSAIRYANAAEAKVLENIQKERQQFISDLADTTALAVVSLDTYKDDLKDQRMAKEIAFDYGFNYNPFKKDFTKIIDGTPVRINLDDMKSYSKIATETDQTFETIFKKPSIVKLHSLTSADVDDTLSDYIDYKGSYLKSGKREIKERTAYGRTITSLMPEGFDLAEFEGSLDASPVISSSDDLLKSINTLYDKEYGNIDEYYSEVKDGKIDASMLNSIASFGKHGDKYITMVGGELAHVNKKEMYLKQMYGDKADEMIMASGAGTINETTNLIQYYTPPQSTMGEQGGGGYGGTGSEEGGGWMELLLAGTTVGTILGVGKMVYGAIEGHQADSRRVGQINNELAELATTLKNTQSEKVDATQNVITSAGIQADAVTSGAGDALNRLDSTYTTSVKSSKGLKTGGQELLLEESKGQVQDQVVAALDNIETKTGMQVEDVAGKYDQQIADIERYEQQLKNEKEQLEGKTTYKIGKEVSSWF